MKSEIKNEIKMFMDNFDNNKYDITITRGLYIYGHDNIGKTTIIRKSIEELGYTIIYYNSIDLKHSEIEDTFSKNKISETCVLSCFNKKKKKLAIIIDDIYCINTSDRNNITNLIKILRPKRTKRQKQENLSNIPIICINNMTTDKKIKELMKICKCIYFDNDKYKTEYINTMRKPKEIVYNMLKNPLTLEQHNTMINETDRTSISLIFHENVIDYMTLDKRDLITYANMLHNICNSDYIERVMFQKQIWILNEITSIIKNVKNNQYLLSRKSLNLNNDNELRFTKVLTKYSTYYNNDVFLSELSQKMKLDIKDVICFFKAYFDNEYEILNEDFLMYDISELDINRMKRMIEVIYK